MANKYPDKTIRKLTGQDTLLRTQNVQGVNHLLIIHENRHTRPQMRMPCTYIAHATNMEGAQTPAHMHTIIWHFIHQTETWHLEPVASLFGWRMVLWIIGLKILPLLSNTFGKHIIISYHQLSLPHASSHQHAHSRTDSKTLQS
jgi:hypothetical protein